MSVTIARNIWGCWVVQWETSKGRYMKGHFTKNDAFKTARELLNQ